MARDDSVTSINNLNAFEGGLGGIHRSEFPEHSVEDFRSNGKDFVSGAAANCPREARGPVAPGLDTGARGAAKRDNGNSKAMTAA